MKFLELFLVSTVVITNVNAVPIDILKYFYRHEAESSLPAFSVSRALNSTNASGFGGSNGTNSSIAGGSNGTNSTAIGGGNHTNSSAADETYLPNIKVYSFSTEFTTLFGNDTNATSLSSLNYPVNLTVSEILSTLNIAGQSPKGNLNATAVKLLASKLSSGTSGIGIGSLLESAGLDNVATLSYEEIANVSSADLNSTYLIDLYNKVNDDLSSDEFDGAVIVQDSQYLEDTAFFLDLVVNSSKPIVLTKDVSISNLLTEGASNLYDSVLVAASNLAANRGTLVVTQKRIASGFYAKRINFDSIDAITSNPQGLIGNIYEGKVQWYYDESDLLTSDLDFTLDEVDSLPDVVVLQNYQGFSSGIISALGESSVEGVVLGSSQSTDSFSKDVKKAIEGLAQSVPVVLSNDQPGSTVSPDDLFSNVTIAGGILDPVKSRILLQVSLAAGYNSTEVKDIFSTVFGG